jgi:CRP-like cAMP-binding protein
MATHATAAEAWCSAALQGRGQAGHAHRARIIRIFGDDPALLAGLDDSSRAEAARRLVACAVDLQAGEPDLAELARLGDLGLLVIDGLVAREIGLGRDRQGWLELLGPGDVVCPQPSREAEPLAHSYRWRVLTSTEVAILDGRFRVAVARWPQIASAVMERVAAQSRRTAFLLAVSHLRHVDARLLITLWTLGDRVGRVTPDGVAIPIRLTHELLARAVAARRPTVSTAVRHLDQRGLLTRTDDGGWLLHGPRPRDVDEAVARAVG